jgi:hypothetical protein
VDGDLRKEKAPGGENMNWEYDLFEKFPDAQRIALGLGIRPLSLEFD